MSHYSPDLTESVHRSRQKQSKIQFYNTVIKSKLTYALETMHLADAQEERIDACQAKGLRQILGMEPTYINRENTNKKVRKQQTRYAEAKKTTKRPKTKQDKLQNSSTSKGYNHSDI